MCCVALVDSGQVNTTPVYRLSTQLLLPPSPASRVETFLPGLLWISKMAILVHTAVMLIACGGLESEGGGAMSLFACFSEKCRGAQRSRQRSAMTDLRLHVASLAYRCYRFWVARLNINIARYHRHMAKRCWCAARCLTSRPRISTRHHHPLQQQWF